MNLPHLNGLAFIPLVILAAYALLLFFLGNLVIATELMQAVKRWLERKDRREQELREHLLRVKGHGNHFTKGGDVDHF